MKTQIQINKNQVTITLDRLEDPEKVTKYAIKNKAEKVLARGYYLHFFGFRLGLHTATEQCRIAYYD